MTDTYLFSQYDLRSVLESQETKMRSEIDRLEPDRILNTSPDELATYFFETYSLEAPQLREADITTDHQEAKVDIRGDPHRAIRDRGVPHFISGTMYTFYVPFSGDSHLFACKPSIFGTSLPRGEFDESELTFRYSRTNHDAVGVRTEFDRDLKDIKTWLANVKNQVEEHAAKLTELATRHINERRERLLGDHAVASSLGFPIRRRDHAPSTYAVPNVRRKLKPSMPATKKEPQTLQPTLAMPEYEHILQVIQSMVLVIERSPSTFQNLGEEDLRSHFLVQLNGQYEGRATGETFNNIGKTDILIREKDKNIFIAECKFWKGAASLAKALNQLLTYATWRDAKLALLIFNRTKDFTAVLKQIPMTIAKHPHCKQQLDYSSETGFRFTVRHPDDKQRELTLTVLAFEVPG